jgi:hypothetical protein
MSERTAQDGFKCALENGIVECISRACHAMRRSAVYKLSSKVPRWGKSEDIENKIDKHFQTRKFAPKRSLSKERKEGSTPTAPTAQPAPEVPPEPKKEGFAWSPESREEIREAVSLLVSCGVSVLGAKKAVNTAFNEKRLDLALEDLQVAQVWIKSQPGIRNQAGFLQTLVGKEANHLRFRDSIRQKSKPLSPAAGSVHRGGGSYQTTASTTRPPGNGGMCAEGLRKTKLEDITLRDILEKYGIVSYLYGWNSIEEFMTFARVCPICNKLFRFMRVWLEFEHLDRPKEAAESKERFFKIASVEFGNDGEKIFRTIVDVLNKAGIKTKDRNYIYELEGMFSSALSHLQSTGEIYIPMKDTKKYSQKQKESMVMV